MHALTQGESGEKVAEICRKLGVSDATYYVEEEVRRAGAGRVAGTAAVA